MKNKSELMFLLKVIIVMFSIILIILFYFLFKSITGNKKTVPKITNKKLSEKYDVDNIILLNFDFKNYEVNYYVTDKDSLIIEQKGKANKIYAEVRKTNNKLLVKESVSNILEKKKFNIYIPKKYKEKISISNGFNNIKIKDLDEVFLNNNAGNVKISNVKSVNIENVSGEINIKGELEKISGTSSTGDIKINSLNGSASIETITGDIFIKNFIIKEKSGIESTSGEIIIKVDKKSDCIFKYNPKIEYEITSKKCINGNNELNLKNVTGNIVIK